MSGTEPGEPPGEREGPDHAGPSDPGEPLSPADEERLRRELEDLEAFLAEHGEEADQRPLDVDVEMRRRKADVLREVLDEGTGEGDRRDRGPGS